MKTKIHKGCKRLYQIEKVNNLKELLNRTEKLYPDNVAFKFKTETPGVFSAKSYAGYIEEA